MFKSGMSQRILYFVIVMIATGLLALRPIPSVNSSNDTGRYVTDFKWQCMNPIFDSSQTSMSWSLFNAILRPICWTGEPRLFLFVAALAVPFAFFLFGKWRKEGLLLSLAALFSMAGFELATNALRQGMGLFFLLFAVRLMLDDKRLFGVLAGVFAAFFHTSNIAYLPLLFWFAKLGYKKRNSAPEMVLFVVLPIFIVSIVAIIAAWKLSDYLEMYQVYYKVVPSASFIIFVSLPILYTYAVRKKIAPSNVSSNETVTMLYSSLLLIITLIFFPTIAYRLAFAGCILQIFIAMDAGNSNSRQGLYLTSGLLLQLGLYGIFSGNPMRVLFG